MTSYPPTTPYQQAREEIGWEIIAYLMLFMSQCLDPPCRKARVCRVDSRGFVDIIVRSAYVRLHAAAQAAGFPDCLPGVARSMSLRLPRLHESSVKKNECRTQASTIPPVPSRLNAKRETRHALQAKSIRRDHQTPAVTSSCAQTLCSRCQNPVNARIERLLKCSPRQCANRVPGKA